MGNVRVKWSISRASIPEAKAICSDKKRVEYDWISPIKTEHMFGTLPKNGSASVEVCVTDRFGNVYKVKL